MHLSGHSSSIQAALPLRAAPSAARPYLTSMGAPEAAHTLGIAADKGSKGAHAAYPQVTHETSTQSLFMALFLILEQPAAAQAACRMQLCDTVRVCSSADHEWRNKALHQRTNKEKTHQKKQVNEEEGVCAPPYTVR